MKNAMFLQAKVIARLERFAMPSPVNVILLLLRLPPEVNVRSVTRIVIPALINRVLAAGVLPVTH